MNKRQKGCLGEDLAHEYLAGSGFKIVERSFRCKLGEIDLIARKGKDLYFIEVKTRWSNVCGHPLESVTLAKQHQIIKTARFYLARNRLFDAGCHLSAIGVDMSGAKPVIEFVPDAFEISSNV